MISDTPLLSVLAGMLADAVGGTSLNDGLIRAAREHLLDTVGIAIAASLLDTSRGIASYAEAFGGRAESTAIGVQRRVPAPMAALVNATMAHSLDFDDTHLPSILHPSASIAPACLAVAEAEGVDGRTMLAALVAGLEVCVRVGMAGYDPVARNSIYFDRGQHATSMCGAIGAAGAVAALMGMDEGEITHSMAIAASMASGIIEANRSGGNVKRMHCGWAAHSAVHAANLVRHGFTGPATALEGRFGFFVAFLSDQARAEEITDGLGSRWSIAEVQFKPYPANHFTHAGIDAALALRARGVGVGDVERIRLGVAGPTVRTIGEPIERKRRPETGYEAQFSGPYTVVAALIGGSGLGLGMDDFDDALVTAPERVDAMAKVDVVEDPWCNEIFPKQFPAVLDVAMRDGSTVSERVAVNRGGPGRPLSEEEVALKFSENARRVLPDPLADRVRDAVAKLPGGGDPTLVLAPTRSLL